MRISALASTVVERSLLLPKVIQLRVLLVAAAVKGNEGVDLVL